MKDRRIWLTSASQSPIRGGQTAARHQGSWRIPVLLAVVFLCTAAFMSAYEFLKESWAPQLTKWESHLVTIAVSSIIATVLSHFVMRWMRGSEAKYRNLFDSSRDALMTLEPPSWKFTAGNPAMLEMFRLKNVRELTTLGPWDISPERQPDGRASSEKAREMIETAVREGFHFFEWTHKRIDGEEFPATVLLTRMEQAGKVVVQAMVRDITEQKRAEEDLEVFKRFTEESAHGVGWADVNGNVIYINPALCRMFGEGRPEDTYGNPVFQYYDEKTQQRLAEEIFPSVLSMGQWLGELDIHGKNGEIVPTTNNLFPLRDREGNPLYFCNVLTDITERRRIQEVLSQSEERYRRVSSATSDIAYSCSATESGGYAIDWMSGATEQITGYSADELKAKRCWRPLVIEEDQALFDEHVVGLAPGSSGSCELRLRHKDGSLRWIASSAECVLSPGDSHTLRLYGGLSDITNRKRVEEALRETNQYLDNLFNYANAPIIVWDPQFRITRFNHAFESLTGRRADEVVGESLEILFPPTLVKSSMECIAETLRGEHWEVVEIRILHVDGAERSVLWNSATIFGSDGKTPIATIAQGQDITKRKQAEESLREVNENLHITLKSIGDAVISTDLVGKISRMNPVAETLTGWTLAEATGRPLPEVFRIINAQTRQPVENPAAKVLETGHIVGLANHTALIARDGTERQIADSGSPIRNAAGQTVGVVLIFRDVTHEYAAAEKLRLLDRAINAAGEGICVTGPNEAGNPLVYINHGFEQLTGYATEEVLGQNMRFLQGADTDQAAVDRMRAAIESDQEFTTELLNYRKDGTPFWNQISITPVKDAAGKVSHFVAVLHDLTDRKRAEEALRIFSLAVQASSDAIGMSTPDGKHYYQNKAFDDLFGDVGDDPPASVFIDNQVGREVFDTIMAGNPWTGEVKMRGRTGEVLDVFERAYPIKDKAGRVLNLVGIHSDITDRKRAEEAMLELLREKESLLKEVHHRVKNNLQVISSLVRLQLTQVENPIAQAALRDIQNRIGSMALLHETLYQSGNFTRVDLTTYLRTLCSQLCHSLVVDPRSIQLHLDVASVGLNVNQAVPCGLLINELVSNCLKHAFPNGRAGEVRVEVQLVDGGPALRLRVADNGVGLPADFDQRQLPSLGLQLVSDLVGQLQGRLEIRRGPGAVFEVVFTPQTANPLGGAS